jgi:hypothetical protein
MLKIAIGYCVDRGIAFIWSRACPSNDETWTEQENAVVRVSAALRIGLLE